MLTTAFFIALFFYLVFEKYGHILLKYVHIEVKIMLNFFRTEIASVFNVKSVITVYYFDNNKLAIRASNKNMQPILAKDLKGNRNIVFPYKDYEFRGRISGGTQKSCS